MAGQVAGYLIGGRLLDVGQSCRPGRPAASALGVRPARRQRGLAAWRLHANPRREFAIGDERAKGPPDPALRPGVRGSSSPGPAADRTAFERFVHPLGPELEKHRVSR